MTPELPCAYACLDDPCQVPAYAVCDHDCTAHRLYEHRRSGDAVLLSNLGKRPSNHLLQADL